MTATVTRFRNEPSQYGSHLRTPPEVALPVLTLRLARREPSADFPGWGSRSIPLAHKDQAAVTLSRDFSSVIMDESGTAMSRHDVGRLGISVHRAWDLGASALLSAHSYTEGTEFLVRDARVRLGGACPRGLEIGCARADAAMWLAHPRTFSVLHNHVHQVLRPRYGLIFLTPDYRELFALDTTPQFLDENILQQAGGSPAIFFSLGFPIIGQIRQRAHKSG